MGQPLSGQGQQASGNVEIGFSIGFIKTPPGLLMLVDIVSHHVFFDVF